ncbi:MAG TPA: YggS family pyridoxal phosphate-dependent enzyme [Burkholderiaceae bacterium]|nr:YggS family pyridoxal phosphate-dependent enzyme [Burkholderiaceae bacterium]
MKRSLGQLWARIHEAEQRYGRTPGSVRLLAVTKAFGPQAVAAAAALGQRAFGENYAQEAIAKMTELSGWGALPALEWHFIGPIQSNKTRLIAEHFHWVQTIDRIQVARRLSAQRPAAQPALQVLLEVNISGETSKAGVTAAELPALALQLAALPQLQLRGLMAIPRPGMPFVEQRASFAKLRGLFESVRRQLSDALAPADAAASGGGAAVHRAAFFDTLSMGMSADFEAAIAEGSTMVRVGSAIFGERP